MTNTHFQQVFYGLKFGSATKGRSDFCTGLNNKGSGCEVAVGGSNSYAWAGEIVHAFLSHPPYTWAACTCVKKWCLRCDWGVKEHRPRERLIESLESSHLPKSHPGLLIFWGAFCLVQIWINLKLRYFNYICLLIILYFRIDLYLNFIWKAPTYIILCSNNITKCYILKELQNPSDPFIVSIIFRREVNYQSL